MRGLSFGHCLALCAALDKPFAALRDNDGKDEAELTESLSKFLKAGRRTLHIGDRTHGPTLEPQLRHCNDDTSLRAILGLTNSKADLATWMEREKTECALRIATADQTIKAPSYITEAAKAIHD